MENIVLIKNLFFKYSKEAILTNLNLKIKKGSIFGLVGKNGAGKTTLLEIMMGLIKAEKGKIKICGYEDSDIFKDKIGFLPEKPYYHQEFKLKEYLIYLGKISSKTIKESEIDKIIELTYLDDFKDYYLKDFSKGMLQRVGLAQTILEKPDLLILDEPLSGLDPVGQDKLRRITLNANNEGTSVFITSHNIHEIKRVCDNIGILHNGKVKMISEDLIEEDKYYHIEFKSSIKEKNLEKNFSAQKINIENNKLKFPVKEKELYFRLMDFLAKRRIEIEKLEISSAGVEKVILDHLNEGDGNNGE